MTKESTKIGRFAPSPSGVMHWGNLLSSLLIWLDIRAAGGELVLRMEDLDPDRSSDSYAKAIADDLKFLGLSWDIGYPENEFRQSSRTKIYEDIFDIFLKKDMLYPCYCSRSERLAAAAPHPGEIHHDSGCKCRHLTSLQRIELEKSGRRPAWKIKVPDKVITFTDGHYGRHSENLSDSGDFIIKRSDGIFAYQLAVSVDDMLMGINRIVRGRDLIGSCAKQIWLINELGGTTPEYCHCPLLISAPDVKLSKRDGALSMDILREKYSAEEILGHLAYLCKLRDLDAPCTADSLIENFSWDKVPMDDILI